MLKGKEKAVREFRTRGTTCHQSPGWYQQRSSEEPELPLWPGNHEAPTPQEVSTTEWGAWTSTRTQQ